MKLTLITFLAASAVQADPGTASVADCTLLRDPTLLRNCIDRFQGQPPAPGMILSRVPSGDVDATGSIVTAPSQLSPSELRAAAGSGRTSGRTSRSKVWIQQIPPQHQRQSGW
jgi:hypothetical protein